MKFNWLRKRIIILAIGLLTVAISPIFAAQMDDNNLQLQQQLEQIQRLQQQAQKAPTGNERFQNQAQAQINQLPISDQPVPASVQPIPGAATPVLPPTTVATIPAPTALPTASTTTVTQVIPASGAIATVPTLPPPGTLPPQAATPAQNQTITTTVNAGTNGTGVVSETALKDQAFKAMTESQLPMTPEQIQKLRQLFNQSQFAATSSPDTPPKPTATSQMVNLAPGATPPVIRLAQGFVSSLVFIDSTGAPWPIDSYDIGNPAAFNIQWNRSDNTLMIQSTTLYTYGNLAVRLQGLNTPVMLTLIPGQKAVDYRVDLRIQGMGPNAIPIPVTGLPTSANPELMAVLDGVPPVGSKEMEVCGANGGVQAWVRGDILFVRTRYTILSPGWTATMSSADGMKAYQMPKAPLLLASQNGKIVQLKVEGL